MTRILVAALLALAWALAGCEPASREAPGVVVGSKAFPESWILGEAAVLLVQAGGVANATHRSNLGGTEIVYQALRSGDVDVYPEYTGTIAEVILKSPQRPSLAEMRAALAKDGIGISDPLGFNDSYALAVTEAAARRYGLSRISDLGRHPDLRLGLTHEFIGRKDGYAGLAHQYALDMADVRGIQHELAYEAIASRQIDVMDIYTTDAQIERLGLRILEDDRGFFPRYDAVWLYRLDLAARAARALQAIQRLAGRIDEGRMIRANARVVLDRRSVQDAAARLLEEALGGRMAAPGRGAGVAGTILARTWEHLRLVSLSLLAAVLAGVPLGVLAARSRRLAALTLSLSGVLQTVPSLALLAFLIPLLGIGAVPALAALFLYSLLPIVRNTYTGLTTIPPHLAEAAEALGLSARTRLFRVSLPQASPAIMAGIKTSAVINVGTATLAALIGGGGLGDPILSGIQLRDHALILQGAVPAAVLAFLVQWGFDLLDRVIIPRGLRLSRERT